MQDDDPDAKVEEMAKDVAEEAQGIAKTADLAVSEDDLENLKSRVEDLAEMIGDKLGELDAA